MYCCFRLGTRSVWINLDISGSLLFTISTLDKWGLNGYRIRFKNQAKTGNSCRTGKSGKNGESLFHASFTLNGGDTLGLAKVILVKPDYFVSVPLKCRIPFASADNWAVPQ
jgi:hypothetical protein